MAPPYSGLLLLAALAAVNIAVDRFIVHSVKSSYALREPPFGHYTWIEDDIPEFIPLMDARPSVLMPFEESVHYAPDGPNAHLDWLATSATEAQDGDVYLGPTDRIAIVVASHELHCLRTMQERLERDHPLGEDFAAHVVHCLGMLREQTLCAADWTLEPGDPLGRNFTLERTFGDRRCSDVDAFYGTLKENRRSWEMRSNSTVIEE